MIKLEMPSMYPASPMIDEKRCPRVYLPNAILAGKAMQPGQMVELHFVGKLTRLDEMEVTFELEEGEVTEKAK
jgi:hypothetical protein